MRMYFGALTFTKPLEKLVFWTVPLQVLLDWLSKPKGPHLVEASGAATPKKALAIAVTRKMLYGDEAPRVGVGLVYKPHYISTEPFSAAYMHLNIWHMAGSQVESEDKLTSSRLLFGSLSEMSSILPVVVQHPILLDVATREMLMKTNESLAPPQFRGFRLHTVWTQQPGQDLILPLIQGTLRQQREAKQVALHQEEGSEGAEASPTKVSAPGRSLQVEAEGSGEAPPGGSVLPRQHVIETTQEILVHIHALCRQAIHEMGSVQELDQTLARALIAEFARLQLIIGQDLTKSLIALQINLETSSQTLLSDVAKTLNLHPTNPASH